MQKYFKDLLLRKLSRDLRGVYNQVRYFAHCGFISGPMGLGWGLNERLILCRAIGMLKVPIFFKNDFKIGDRRQDGQGTPTGFSIFEPGSGNVLLLKFL